MFLHSIWHRVKKVEMKTITINAVAYPYIDTGPVKSNDRLENPVLIAPGWNQPIAIWREHIDRLSRVHTRRVIMIEAPQGVIPSPNMQLPSELETLAPSIINKSLALTTILEALSIDRVDVIAHSQGGIDAIAAALLEPERFAHIILFNPAGMIGSDKLPHLMGRFLLDAFSSLLKSPNKHMSISQKKIDRKIFEQAIKHPIVSMRAAHAITTTQLEEMILLLNKQYGVQMMCVVGQDDQVFPLDKIQSRADLQSLRGFISIKGDHADIFKRPKLYMGLATYLLSAMESLEEINYGHG